MLLETKKCMLSSSAHGIGDTDFGTFFQMEGPDLILSGIVHQPATSDTVTE